MSTSRLGHRATPSVAQAVRRKRGCSGYTAIRLLRASPAEIRKSVPRPRVSRSLGLSWIWPLIQRIKSTFYSSD